MSKPSLLYSDTHAEVWIGDSQDAEHVAVILNGRRPDAMIVDAPYSERTHKGHDSGRLSPEQLARYAQRPGAVATRERRYAARKGAAGEHRRRLDYAPWDATTVENFCDLWCPLVAGWCVSLTDHELARHWWSSFDCNNLCTFAPLPFVETGSRVRMTGDGPSNWSCWTVVARPRSREYASWGTLPGAYVVPGERAFNSAAGSDRVVGGKPLAGMTQIVRDYSRRGALIVDPCAGAGTTGVAAKIMGRRSILIDRDPEHAAIAARRLADTKEQLAIESVAAEPMEQTEMFA